MKTLKELHTEVYCLIKDNHTHSEKKRHGRYLGITLFDESVIWMDDYNSAITWSNKFMHNGIYFGLDFGGFESHVSKNKYLEAIAFIKSTITPNPCRINAE
jgi:hypothetical protein|tara:strand:- start:202 stop:504 length:303 start_codon:yes stop_codon:yes gene_type:complete